VLPSRTSVAHVRFGSEAEVKALHIDVRFAPESGHVSDFKAGKKASPVNKRSTNDAARILIFAVLIAKHSPPVLLAPYRRQCWSATTERVQQTAHAAGMRGTRAME